MVAFYILIGLLVLAAACATIAFVNRWQCRKYVWGHIRKQLDPKFRLRILVREVHPKFIGDDVDGYRIYETDDGDKLITEYIRGMTITAYKNPSGVVNLDMESNEIVYDPKRVIFPDDYIISDKTEYEAWTRYNDYCLNYLATLILMVISVLVALFI